MTAIDLAPGPAVDLAGCEYLRADATILEGEALTAVGTADCALNCLPENAALLSLAPILANLPPRSLWIDTLSVKMPVCAALEARLDGREALSINPMFAPGPVLSAGRVAVIRVRIGPLGGVFLDALARAGCALVFLTAEEHDRATAAIQAATHAAILSFGLTLDILGYDISASLAIATPPHLVLLAVLARILSMNPEVYWDIQHHNRFAAEARRALIEAASRLDDVASAAQGEAFEQMLLGLKRVIGPQEAPLAQLASDLLARTKGGGKPR